MNVSEFVKDWLIDNNINADVVGNMLVMYDGEGAVKEELRIMQKPSPMDITNPLLSFVFVTGEWVYKKCEDKVSFLLGNYKKSGTEREEGFFGIKSLTEIGGSTHSYEAYAEKLASLGYKTASTCETTLGGSILFQMACKSKGIKPIIGFQIPSVFGSVCLLPKNDKGYSQCLFINNEMKIKSRGFEKELLVQATDCFVIFLIGFNFEKFGSVPEGLECFCQFKELANEAEFKWVKTSPFKRTLFQQANCLSNSFKINAVNIGLVHGFDNKPIPVRTNCLSNLSEEFAKECLDNNKYISQNCNFEINLDLIKLPKLKGVDDSYKALREICDTEMVNFFSDKTPEEYEKYSQRLEHELDTINRGGFCDYFLIFSKLCRTALDRGIYIGHGRGSVCGSLVAYLCKIHFIDPLQYGLVFERFLNDARFKSMPDIDLDIEGLRRSDVIDILREEFGKDNVANIGSYGIFKSKNAIKSAARYFGVETKEFDFEKDYKKSKKKSDFVDDDIITSIYIVSQKNAKFREYCKKHSKALNFAISIFGGVNNRGVHASGVIVSNSKISDIMPIYDAKGIYATDFEKTSLDSANYAKLDILGLECLDKFRFITNKLSSRGVALDLYKIPIDDPKVYQLIKTKSLVDVFQLSSNLQSKFVYDSKACCIDDLAVSNAVLRPGPMKSKAHEEYIKIKNGDVDEFYDYQMDDITFDTRGLWLYQEQVMNAFCKVTGKSLTESDSFRKYISKLKGNKNIKGGEAYETAFKEGYVKLGASGEQVENLWDKLIAFAEYGFNKSHAIAYSTMGYLCMYFKRHYPNEFYLSALTFADDSDIADIVDEASLNQNKINIPDINKSGGSFSYANGKVYFGLSSVKGVGKVALEEILANRGSGYHSFSNFVSRIAKGKVNSGVLFALIFSGAFDEVENITNLHSRLTLAKEYGVKIPECDVKKAQSDLLGVNLFCFADLCYDVDGVRTYNYMAINEKGMIGVRAAVCGLVVLAKEGITSTGKRFVNLHLRTDGGILKTMIWQDKLELFESFLQEGKIIAYNGVIKHDTFFKTQNIGLVNWSEFIEI